MFEPLISSPFFVGAAGALVSLRFSGLAIGWRVRAFNFLCGALIAGYLTPPLAGWLKLSNRGDVLGVAFVVGLLGLSVVAAVFKAIDEGKLNDALNALLRTLQSWLGRSPKE